MIAIGITGQAGFIGTHLYNTLGLHPDKYQRIPFEDSYFDNEEKLTEFLKKCDVVVHLAAMNRHPDPKVIFQTNILLVKKLISAMEKGKSKPCILFSSSTQEKKNNEYGKSKKEGRKLLEKWAQEKGSSFTGMIIPNVYGPFGKPDYNSFISTFCHKLINGENPEIFVNTEVQLIYIDSLCKFIIKKINENSAGKSIIENINVPFDFEDKVSSILSKLENFKQNYLFKGNMPDLSEFNVRNLFNTFRSYIKLDTFFPRSLQQFSDERGSFCETIRTNSEGQVSISVTNPGFVRGNHFHTRKIERFVVIKGKAEVQLRKIGDKKVIDVFLDGDSPSYIDIPIWYTHNIRNVGKGELITQFWINECFDPNNSDTYIEKV